MKIKIMLNVRGWKDITIICDIVIIKIKNNLIIQ